MPADWDIPMAKIVETEEELDDASKVRSVYRHELLKQARRVKQLESAATVCAERLICHRLCDHWEQADWDAVDAVRDAMPNDMLTVSGGRKGE